jgi:hypothetical protein
MCAVVSSLQRFFFGLIRVFLFAEIVAVAQDDLQPGIIACATLHDRAFPRRWLGPRVGPRT